MKKIRQISVTNLFGIFNHTIPLNIDDRVTIIHSPNGFGKTAILRLINELFSQRNRVKKDSAPKITLYFRGDDGERSFSLKASPLRALREAFPLSMIDRVIPEADRIGGESWRISPTGEILSFEEMVERYSDHLMAVLGSSVAHEKEPEWLREIRGSVPIRFIETQRLLNPRRIGGKSEYERFSSMASTVTMYSEELAEIIKTKLAESTALSQSL